MFSDKEFWFGIASVLVNAVGYYPYIKGILDGHVKPQRITWGIWSILTSVTFINQVVNGGGYSTFFFGSTTLLVVTVFLLSIKKGVGGKSKFDVAVLIFSLLLFALWAITKDTRTTTIIAIAIDTIATLPTLYKAYVQPETELYLQWMMAGVSGFLSMIALGGSNDYILFAYPAYVIAMNSIIVLAKAAGTARKSKSKQ